MNLNALETKSDTSDSPVDENVAMMPLGTGEFGGDSPAVDPLAGIVDEDKASSGALVIVIVILLAAGVLIGMKFFSNSTTPQNAAAGDIKAVDEWIDGRSGQNLASWRMQQELLDSLGQNYSEVQVPLGNIARDPFLLVGVESAETNSVTAVGPTGDPTEIARRMLEERKVEVRAEFERVAEQLTLQSTMLGGSRPMASLSNQIVLGGDTFTSSSVQFKVIEITTDSVTVLAENRELNVVVTHTITIRRN